MNRLVAKDLDDAVLALTLFRGWRPFRYSGNVFYLVEEDSECYRIYRTKKSAVDYALKMSKECVRVDYKGE
jgi:hypothetical protein